jgi:hypothetical protein
VLARCPSCRNTFSTERAGRQFCPVCGKPLVVPEPPFAPGGTQDAGPVAGQAGTPWERRKDLGFWNGWAQTMQQALLEPARLFASARLDRGAAQLGFAVFTTSVFWALGQIVEGVLLRGQRDQLRRMLASLPHDPQLSPLLQRLMDAQAQASAPGWVIAFALFTPLCTVVFLYLNAGVTHAFAALMGQAKRGFAATFAACAYACAPLVLLALPACGSVIALVWLIVLTSIGVKITHGISAGAAAASVLAPYLVLCCLMFFALGSMMMALRGALGRP